MSADQSRDEKQVGAEFKKGSTPHTRLVIGYCRSRYGALGARFSILTNRESVSQQSVLKSAGATHFLKVTDIDWIEGAGVYVTVHVAGKGLLYRAALNQLAARLDPVRFIRVHRSAIVNIDSIVRLEPVSHGEFSVILKNGGQTRVSRTYRFALEQRLGQSL